MTLTVNGETHEVVIEHDRALLDVLRTDLGLRGTKTGCREGRCGACTVLLGGIVANACLVLAAGAGLRPITTIEGLARDGVPHPVQQAFVDHGAIQCGYCTPG